MQYIPIHSYLPLWCVSLFSLFLFPLFRCWHFLVFISRINPLLSLSLSRSLSRLPSFCVNKRPIQPIGSSVHGIDSCTSAVICAPFFVFFSRFLYPDSITRPLFHSLNGEQYRNRCGNIDKFDKWDNSQSYNKNMSSSILLDLIYMFLILLLLSDFYWFIGAISISILIYVVHFCSKTYVIAQLFSVLILHKPNNLLFNSK